MSCIIIGLICSWIIVETTTKSRLQRTWGLPRVAYLGSYRAGRRLWVFGENDHKSDRKELKTQQTVPFVCHPVSSVAGFCLNLIRT